MECAHFNSGVFRRERENVTAVGPNITCVLEQRPAAIDAPRMSLHGETVEAFQGRWHVARIKSREERAFTELCEQREIPYFLPMRRVRRLYSDGKRKTLWLAQLPGYAFICGDMDEVYAVQKLPSCFGFLRETMQDEPHTAISLAVQKQLRTDLMWLERGMRDAQYDTGDLVNIGIGQHVRVLSGAMEGYEGRVIERDDKMQLVIAVNFMSRGVPLHMDPYNVEIIDV